MADMRFKRTKISTGVLMSADGLLLTLTLTLTLISTGVLVSADGLLLTAAHAVYDIKKKQYNGSCFLIGFLDLTLTLTLTP